MRNRPVRDVGAIGSFVLALPATGRLHQERHLHLRLGPLTSSVGGGRSMRRLGVFFLPAVS